MNCSIAELSRSVIAGRVEGVTAARRGVRRGGHPEHGQGKRGEADPLPSPPQGEEQPYFRRKALMRSA